MKRTWRPTAAGVLCIIAGAIFLVTPLVFALPFVGMIPLVGGIYAFKRRIWGLVLAGSIT